MINANGVVSIKELGLVCAWMVPIGSLSFGGDRCGWFLIEKVGGDERLVAEDGQVAVGVG